MAGPNGGPPRLMRVVSAALLALPCSSLTLPPLGKALQSAQTVLPRVADRMPPVPLVTPRSLLPADITFPPVPFWPRQQVFERQGGILEDAFHSEENESPFLVLLALGSLAFRAVGYLGAAAAAAAAAAALFSLSAVVLPNLPGSVTSVLPPEAAALLGFFLHGSAAAWAAAGPIQRSVSLWLVTEGAFYAFCNVLARRMSAFRPSDTAPGPLSSERRAECWRRILADPTQHPRTFVEGWFYHADTSTGTSACRDIAHGSALSALRGYANSLLGRGGGADSASAAAAAAGAAAAASGGSGGSARSGGGDPGAAIRYAQLRRADVNHWLASGLFERRLAELTPAERHELDGLVDTLEAAVGAPLLDAANADAPSPGIRSMRMATDDVQW